MKISTLLDHIDSGHMALPEFQRGYVWNRAQVRSLFTSLYRRHPVGGLLVWATDSVAADHRGDGPLASGIVKLLLDGQQRITSLYGVARGRPPKFFEGNRSAFENLHFHLESETFEFYQPLKMADDPLWIDVTRLMQKGQGGLGEAMTRLVANPDIAARVPAYVGHLSRILGILDIDLHLEEITGQDMTLDVVVEIFNRVNSGGTKLSKGDLALAKICAGWPEGREAMNAKLAEWRNHGYEFNLDWLLRSVNTVLTGEAKFLYLHERGPEEVQDALARTCRWIDQCLNLIGGRLGLDHDRVFFGRFGVPVMVRFLDQRHRQGLGAMDEKLRDKLLFWYAQAAMWGRFSGSTESYIDRDLEAIKETVDNLDPLLEELRLWNGGLRAEPGHFGGSSRGARFYPVLYMLTRMGEARDWGTGLPLKANLLGRMNHLEVHHIFPKALLYKAKGHGFTRGEVNAVANFCFLTKDTNLAISDRPPEEYFPEIEAAHPGALASQWIPQDPALWRPDRYRDFLAARRELLAAELNRVMETLLHGDGRWMAGASAIGRAVPGGFASDEEEASINELNARVAGQALPAGEVLYEQVDAEGRPAVILDLAWPRGLQDSLSEPVAVLLDEEAATVALASEAGFRCFTGIEAFRRYVQKEVQAG